jgi:CRP-like cAMP-binding protein
MNLGPTVTHDPAAEGLLESLLPSSDQERHLTRLPAGTVIHRFGSPSRGIFFVKEGTIEVSLPAKDGSARSIFSVGKGGAVGLTAALSGGAHEFDATVLEPVIGVFVPAELLRDWLVADPSRYFGVARVLSEWNERAIVALRTRRCQGRRRARP